MTKGEALKKMQAVKAYMTSGNPIWDVTEIGEAFGMAIEALEQPEQRWIPCSERLPEEYGEYRITWTTSYAPSKRLIGDSEYEVTSVWDEDRGMFKGEWLLDAYIQAYPDVKVIAWKPLEEPYKGELE